MTTAPRRPHRPHWHPSDADRAFLVETYTTLTAVEQARRLGQDYNAVLYQRQRLIRAGLADRQRRFYRVPYTADDDARIVELAQQGACVRTIARQLGRSLGSLVTHIVLALGGIGRLRADELSRVRTSREVAALFGVTKRTANKWIDRGWLPATFDRAVRARRQASRRGHARVPDAQIQAFMAKRACWPAWHPSDIADPDWQQYARDVRDAAGGRWVTIREIARASGLRHTRLYAWARKGKLDDLDVMTYDVEYLVWSADADKVVARIRAHRRGGAHRPPEGVRAL